MAESISEAAFEYGNDPDYISPFSKKAKSVG